MPAGDLFALPAGETPALHRYASGRTIEPQRVTRRQAETAFGRPYVEALA